MEGVPDVNAAPEVPAEAEPVEAPAEAPAAAEAPADAEPQPGAAPSEGPAAADAPAEQAAAPGDAATAPAEQPAAPAEPAVFHLTVAGLPADCKDEDVRALFEKFPGLKEVSVQRDGEACTGGATVVFEARDGAEAAVAELNCQAAIPADAEQKLEVRLETPAAAAPAAAPAAAAPVRRVFFSGCPMGVRREDVEEVFGYYGPVNRAELLVDFHSRTTRGCGFVFYKEQKSAEDAIAAMHGAYTFPGGAAPMTVRWAEDEPPHLSRKRKADDDHEDLRQLFIAKITRSIPEDDIRALLSHYGAVERINMFKPTPDAVYHKGCGVVTFSKPFEAEAAMRALDEVYIWPGMKEPMVAKYNESESNKRRREDDMRMGPRYLSLEPPPPGCDPDALKVYVGNIPPDTSVDEIRDTFKGFGRVIQILLARDKATGQPKGSAYIWFQRRRDADLAIKRLNGSTTAFRNYGVAHAVGAYTAEEAAATAAQPAAAEQPAAEGAEPTAADGAAAAEGGPAEGSPAVGAEGAAAGAEGAAGDKPAEQAKPKPDALIVSIAQSSVKQMRPGDRPPEWMRQGPAGGPYRPVPPGAPPLNMPVPGGPPGWGAPPPGWGAPPQPGYYGGAPGYYGGAPPAAQPGYDPYGYQQQAAYAPQQGWQQPAQAWPQQPSPAAPSPVGPPAAAPAYPSAYPAQQPYPGQPAQPAAAPAGAPSPTAAYAAPPTGQPYQQPVGGYASYPGAAAQQAPAQQAPAQQYQQPYGY